MTRSRISAAALLVNVIARICPGCAPWASCQAIRWVSTRVLPEPAPATMSSGDPECTTASRCWGFMPSSSAAACASACSRRRSGRGRASSGRASSRPGSGRPSGRPTPGCPDRCDAARWCRRRPRGGPPARPPRWAVRSWAGTPGPARCQCYSSPGHATRHPRRSGASPGGLRGAADRGAQQASRAGREPAWSAPRRRTGRPPRHPHAQGHTTHPCRAGACVACPSTTAGPGPTSWRPAGSGATLRDVQATRRFPHGYRLPVPVVARR